MHNLYIKKTQKIINALFLQHFYFLKKAFIFMWALLSICFHIFIYFLSSSYLQINDKVANITLIILQMKEISIKEAVLIKII